MEIASRLFQLVHKEDFNLLLKFWVHLGGELQYIYLLWFCSVLPLLAVSHLACLKVVQLSPGMDYNFTIKGDKVVFVLKHL